MSEEEKSITFRVHAVGVSGPSSEPRPVRATRGVVKSIRPYQEAKRSINCNGSITQLPNRRLR